VYIEIIEHVIRQGKQAIVLIPEIALTYQTVKRFRNRFGDKVTIMNSRLSKGERYDQFERAKNGDVSVMIGPRSALFAPFKNLGIIVIDEEHETTYKSDQLPKYHAREVAIHRAKMCGATVLLGSATPSLESKARAYKKVYGYAELNVRASSKAALPATHIIDLGLPKATTYQPRHLTREDGEQITKPNAIFSKILFDKIGEKLEKKEQIILLINRRGYSSFLTCGRCGHIFTCPSCHSNLSYHRIDEMLKCHHCGYVMRYPEVCPECGSPKIQRVGFGTERIVKVLNEQFPEAKVGRLDSDVTKVRNNLTKVLGQFRNGEFDILVGTQMIAKGHDFPNVTLVGVVLADIGLTLPSYRAAESTFELITQAVGRSGRADKPGEAYIQTYNPTHYAITFGAKQDYEGFFYKEMQSRKISQTSPYTFQILMLFSGKDEERVILAANEFREHLVSKQFEGLTALGPIAPFYEFVGDNHRRYLLLKCKKPIPVKEYISSLANDLSGKGGISITFDVDPIDC
ncbi:MAG: primosomal protein N', partial [Bacilli bacterium]|nr:primosomal protein N' [Bacilli bacterium]